MKLLTKARYTDEANERELRNLDLAYRAACESIVLLENRGVLPLQSKAGKKGRIPEEALRRCCANVVKSIFDSAIRREYLNS